MESNWNQLIDRYFAGELSADGLEAFEQLRKTDSQFSASVEFHALALEGLKRIGQRNEIAQLGKAYHFRQLLKKWLLIAGAGILIIAAIVAYVFHSKKATREKYKEKTEQAKSESDAQPFSVAPQQVVSNAQADSTKDYASKNELLVEANLKQNNNSGTLILSDQGKVIAHLTASSSKPSKEVQDQVTGVGIALMDTSFEVQKEISNEAFMNATEFPVLERYSTYYNKSKVGLKDTLGKVILNAKFDSIGLVFSSYTSKVAVERYVRVFNNVRSIETSNVYFFKALEKQKWYLFNNKLEQLTAVGFDEISDGRFSEGLILVRNNNKYGLIDYTGNIVLPCEYDKLENNSGKLAGYKGNQKIRISAVKMK